ncbi:hypothetical protein Gpo141_00005972 [Globisporangium polare]
MVLLCGGGSDDDDTIHATEQQQLRPQHDLAARDEGEKALTRESFLLVEGVQEALEAMLTLQELPRHGSLSDFQPKLTLHFSRHPMANDSWRKMIRNGLSPRRIAAALHAIEVVLSHSAKLKKYGHPGQRSAFWLLLIASKAMSKERTQPVEYLEWLVEHSDDFFPPRVVLEFGDLNEKQMDAVCRFFIRDSDPQQLQYHQRRIYCQFELSFTDCSLSMRCLRLIQRLLDDVSSPELAHRRHFSIHSLDLSWNALLPAQLDVVAGILSKKHVYQLRGINLASVTWLSPAAVNQKSLVRLTRAAFSNPDAGAQQSTKSLRDRQSRRSISLAVNPFREEDFAAMGASLRYGCVYDKVSLSSMLRFSDSVHHREQCWRWIAFGLFYPRSRRFASAFHFREINMSRISLDPEAMPAFARTLANPVAAFRRSNHEEHQTEPDDSIIVCHLAQGATIYSAPNKTSTPLMTLDKPETWEALYTRGDTEWLNVIVPGHGLSWVEAHHVGEREEEMLVETARVGFIMKGFSSQRPSISLDTLMRSVGHRLNSLELDGVGGLDLDALFDSCTNLEHLSLEGTALSSDKFSQLSNFLQSTSGQHLKSLNLNSMRLHSGDAWLLARVLKRRGCLPKLRELRIYNRSMSANGLERLSAALDENRTLAIVEFSNAHRADERDALHGKHNNTVVEMTALPLRHKLAFMSVIVSQTSSAAKAGNYMEQWIFERIFELAGLPVQRKVLWTSLLRR